MPLEFLGDSLLPLWNVIGAPSNTSRITFEALKAYSFTSGYLPSPDQLSSRIIAYADADLGGDPEKCKSTSGHCYYIEGILVGWRSSRQMLVAQSTMEAELITTSTALSTLDWLQGLNHEAKLGFNAVSRVYNDNLNCVTTLGNGNLQATSRHLQI
jgi:hypothetical protein